MGPRHWGQFSALAEAAQRTRAARVADSVRIRAEEFMAIAYENQFGEPVETAKGVVRKRAKLVIGMRNAKIAV